MDSGWLVRGATWIATYCLHAAAWGAFGALLARRRELPAAARHSILKCALFGPLLTAWLAVLARGGGRWPAESGLPANALRAFSAEGSPLADALRALPDAVHAGLRASSTGCGLLLGCWLSAFAVGLLRLGVSGVLLQRRLRSRRPIESGRVCERFAEVLRRSALRRVRLTACAEAEVPFAIGLREICVPATSLGALSDAELDAVLAHELAHLERRDGLWFPAMAALQALFWLQPLNHLLSWRVRHWAELACDDRALELTGDPLILARALTRVAERASASGWGFAPSAARSARSLLERVRRLAALRTGASFPARVGRIRGRMAALTALGAALCSFRLDLAQAAPAIAVGAPSELAASESHLDATPGEEDFCRQLNDLVQAEQRLEQQLSSRAAAEDPRRAELSSGGGGGPARRGGGG
jgi:Zn-dependent protease with chaperone function